MRRVSMFLTMLVLAAVLLAACGGQETSTSVPSTNVPPVTMESTSTEAATEVATEAATEPASTDMTTTPAVPVTGENSLARVSNLIGTSVCGMGGDQLGTVQDLVLDFDQAPAMITYMIVDANGRNIAVPYASFATFSAAGTGMGAGAGTGTGSSTTVTDTPQAGTTDTTATADPNATASSGTGTGTGTGTDTMGQQNCLALTVDNDMFNNAPDFDQSTLPAQGQSGAGWDTSISGYWQGGGTGTGTDTTGTQATDTPSAGTDMTAVPTTTASTGGTGTGTGTGQGAQKMQGIMLASDLLGATVTVSPQGNDQGTGTGTGTGIDTTSTPDPNATSTTGGTGTGTGAVTGDFSQGTVQDIVIEPEDGDLEYLVVSFGTDTRLFPLPLGFLRWDAATNGIVLMVNQNALQNAPAFTLDQFPDTTVSGWDQQYEDYWNSNGGAGMGTGTGSGGVTIATATP